MTDTNSGNKSLLAQSNPIEETDSYISNAGIAFSSKLNNPPASIPHSVIEPTDNIAYIMQAMPLQHLQKGFSDNLCFVPPPLSPERHASAAESYYATCRSSGDPVLIKNAPAQEAKKENIIIIGAEKANNSFWLKMMFMSCGYAVAAGTLKPEGWTDADMTTVFVTTDGYNKAEISKIQQLEREGRNIKVVLINSLIELIAPLNMRLKIDGLYKINRLAIFSHGYIFWDKDSVINLRYEESIIGEGYGEVKGLLSRQMVLSKETISRLDKDIFSDSAIFYSYACRTGTGTSDEPEKPADPHAEDSLARFIANHFNIKVRAFYRRTLYKYVMIPETGYENTRNAIRAIMKQKREGLFKGLLREGSSGNLAGSLLGAGIFEGISGGLVGKGLSESLLGDGLSESLSESLFRGQSFDINEEYEALFHYTNGYNGRPHTSRYLQAGVGAAGLGSGGPVAEGVTGYALWRKGGALNLPIAAESPKGFPPDFAVFEPDGK